MAISALVYYPYFTIRGCFCFQFLNCKNTTDLKKRTAHLKLKNHHKQKSKFFYCDNLEVPFNAGSKNLYYIDKFFLLIYVRSESLLKLNE